MAMTEDGVFAAECGPLRLYAYPTGGALVVWDVEPDDEGFTDWHPDRFEVERLMHVLREMLAFSGWADAPAGQES